MWRVIITLVGLLAAAPIVAAQNPTVIEADRFRLRTGPCLIRSGSGTPEGVVIGRPCDTYLNTADGVLWVKWTGTATTTGWNVGHNANARVNGTSTLTGFVGEPNYVSQLTTWRIDATGGADFRYLFTDELHARVFIADLEQALAGLQIICKSVGVLGATFTNPATSGAVTLTMRDLPSANNMAIFQSGDYVGLRSFSRAGGSLSIAESFGVVTAYADQANGLQTWTYTRGAGADGGGMSTSTVVQPDSIVVDYGTSGNGCHEVNAIDGAYGLNSPYAQTWTWTTSPISVNRSIRTRLGNLRGISGDAAEYGIFAGNGVANTSQFIIASSQRVALQNVDLSIYRSGTEVIRLDRTAPSLAIGNAVPTAYLNGAGIWMGRDTDGLYKWRAGNPGADGIFWDGATLTVRGTGGQSRNQIRNSECRVGTEDYSTGWTTATQPTLSFNFPSWRLNEVSNTCYLTEAGTPGAGTFWNLIVGGTSGVRFPVQVGSRYEASFYVGLHRVNQGYAAITWYDAAGAQLSTAASTMMCTSASTGGLNLSGYCRTGLVTTAPFGAVTAVPLMVAAHNGGGANPYMFVVRAFFAEATSTQTALSDWGPGGITEITGGMIRTDAIIARHITTDQIIARHILAEQVTTAKIAAGAITAEKIAANTITGNEIAAIQLSAISGDMGTLTAGTITGGSISGVTITGVTINGTNTLSGTAISGGSIDIGSGSFIVSSIGDLTAAVGTSSILPNLQTNILTVYTSLQLTPASGGGQLYACFDNSGVLFAASSC